MSAVVRWLRVFAVPFGALCSSLAAAGSPALFPFTLLNLCVQRLRAAVRRFPVKECPSLLLASGLLCGIFGTPLYAQSLPLPETPVPHRVTAYRPKPNDSYQWNAGVLCAIGGSVSSVAAKPTLGCGAGLTFAPLPLFFEVGVMGPQAHRSSVSGYLSLDGSLRLARADVRYLPFVLAGYSRLFETGHALDYGVALATPRPGKHADPTGSLRLELRDYWTFANPNQHNVVLRVGWMNIVRD